jgi:hypothetical protein
LLLTVENKMVWFPRYQFYFFRLSERDSFHGRGKIMRRYLWLAGVLAGMACAGGAHAQKTSRTINIMPSFTNNSPMDYRNPNAPIGGTTFRNSNSRLSQLMYSPTRMNTINNTTPFGKSIFPTPAQMQAAAPSYFRPFQMYRASFISP